MHALNPEDNACIACVACVACIAFERPFEGQRMGHANILLCEQRYCTECFAPWVVLVGNNRQARYINGMRAPMAEVVRSANLCAECLTVRSWSEQAHHYAGEIHEREHMIDGSMAVLGENHQQVYLEARRLKELQKSRRRSNRDRYWGGKKPSNNRRR